MDAEHIPAVIVPCRDAGGLLRIADALSAQKCALYAVMDRTDPPSSRLPGCVTVLRNESGDGFLAGKCRDIGLTAAYSAGHSEFLFCDGDCVPQGGFVSAHSRVLGCPEPVITIGRRLEKQYGWMDRRECEPDLMNLGLFRGKGALVSNVSLVNRCIVTWSCNMGMNRKAADRIYRFNLRYFGERRAFLSRFDGRWGGEDSFLGIEAWITRCLMQFVSAPLSGVSHMDHPRPSGEYNLEHMKKIAELKDELMKKCASDPMDWSFFA